MAEKKKAKSVAKKAEKKIEKKADTSASGEKYDASKIDKLEGLEAVR